MSFVSQPPQPTQPSPRPIVAVLAGSGVAVALMQTLVIPLVPDLPRLLRTSAADATWVLTATLLAGAVATPVLGRLGDLYGKRRLLLTSTIALIAGSLVCALSDSLAPVVAGRALQGMSIGLIPLGISIMRDELPPDRLGSAMAVMSSSLGVGGALGLPVAAAIAQYADWHALFWASAGLGTLMAVLILLVVPESPVRARARFDPLGAVGLTAGLVCLLLPITKGRDWGWTDGTTLGLFGAAAVILPLWAWWELRASAPLVDLRTTARRQILLTNLASIMVGFALYAQALTVPQILQLPPDTGYGLGLPMLEAGLWMAPGGLVMMAVSPLAARLSRARGPKVSLLIGSLIIAAGYLVAIPLMGQPWGVALLSGCVLGAGIGLAYAAMPALIMGAVPLHETAAANGLNALMRSIGTSVSSAVIGAVLAAFTVHVGPVPLPSRGGQLAGLLIGATAALVAALVTLGVPGRRTASPLPPEPAAVFKPKD